MKHLYNPLSVSRDVIFCRKLERRDFPIQAEPLHNVQARPNLTFRITEESKPRNYRITQQVAQLMDDEMSIYQEKWLGQEKNQMGLGIGDHGLVYYDAKYAKTLAHELGHVMGLPHRGAKEDEIGDNLKIPKGKNLMSYGEVKNTADFDLIQGNRSPDGQQFRRRLACAMSGQRCFQVL